MEGEKYEKGGVTMYSVESGVGLEDLTEEQLNYYETKRFLKQKVFKISSKMDEYPLTMGHHLIQKAKFKKFGRVASVLSLWTPMARFAPGTAKLTVALLDKRGGGKVKITGHTVDAAEPMVICMNMFHYVDIDEMKDVVFATMIESPEYTGAFSCGSLVMKWNLEFVGKVVMLKDITLPPVRVPRIENDIDAEFNKLLSSYRQTRKGNKNLTSKAAHKSLADVLKADVYEENKEESMIMEGAGDNDDIKITIAKPLPRI